MGVYLYYLPGRKDLSAADLRAAGLGRVFQGIEPSRGQLTHGPDGKAGALVAAALHVDQHVAYRPQEQTWRPVHGKAYWVGLDREALPCPEHLRREHLVGTIEWDLGDGRSWLLPTARLQPEGIGLPQAWGLDAEGRPCRTILQEYAELWRHAERVWQHCMGGARLTPEEALGIACECLAINYRLGLEECLLSGLINDQVIDPILWILVDYPTYLAEQKKITSGADQPI